MSSALNIIDCPCKALFKASVGMMGKVRRQEFKEMWDDPLVDEMVEEAERELEHIPSESEDEQTVEPEEEDDPPDDDDDGDDDDDDASPEAREHSDPFEHDCFEHDIEACELMGSPRRSRMDNFLFNVENEEESKNT